MGNFFGLIRSSERSSSEDVFVPGLRNLGNNCFLNVILQALASCVSFRNFLKSNIERLQSSVIVEKQVDGYPLLVSLATLLEDLCTLQDRRITLNPREVMSAMHLYISHFDLTSQQDAAESFLHLLSCLREELSESYVPRSSSLADVASPSGRTVSFKAEDNTSEPIRWRKQFIGPFDGIYCSCLTCQSCGTEIIMDSQFFHTLPLSPMVAGCTVEDCIKRFMDAERVENYECSRCWHDGASKFLSLVEGHEKERKKLSGCNERDSCTCRNMPGLEAFPWSNRFSQTFKQLSIACYPKILCLHLQRTSVNAFGELIKLQGHISFQLLLGLSGFVKHKVGIEGREEHTNRQQAKHHVDLIRNGRNLNITGIAGRCIDHAGLDQNTSKSTAVTNADDTCSQLQSPGKVACQSSCADGPMYRLVSVVEHFGKAGSGHYTVYRGLGEELVDGNDEVSNDLHLRWFCISDTEVNPASEEEVLAADATLLFYERFS